MIDRNAKIFICGHRGMVGSACVRKFEKEGYSNILKRARAELDLRNQLAVKEFFDADSLEGIVKRINRPDENGDGLSDFYIEKYEKYIGESI